MLSLLHLERALPTGRAGVCARVVKSGETLGCVSGDARRSQFVGFYGIPMNVQPTHTDPRHRGGGAGS